jgi:peptidoglycan/LPS O-acetylase OafA/YrhL
MLPLPGTNLTCVPFSPQHLNGHRMQIPTETIERDTSRDRRLGYLDGWRGVALLAVFMGHFAPLPGIGTARLGVELFFVLSGRLMAEILFVERYPLDLFYRRRIARVWPAMVVFVIVMRLVFTEPTYFLVRWLDVASALSLSLNYIVIYFHRMPMIEHVWSLCIEEWAYLLLGLLAYLARRSGCNPLWLIAAVALACVINGVIQSLAGADYYIVYWRTDVRIASILMATAVYLGLRQFDIQASTWLPIVSGLAGLLLSLKAFPDAMRYSLGTLCFAVAVASIDRAPAWLLRLLSHGAIRQIGLWSFSLYLWQQPFYKLIHAAPRPLLLAGAIGMGLISFYLVEQPLRRYLNSRWPGRAVAAS